eukprot:scaffold118581_cov65-Attheya_sp.AAC.3
MDLAGGTWGVEVEVVSGPRTPCHSSTPSRNTFGCQSTQCPTYTADHTRCNVFSNSLGLAGGTWGVEMEV